MNLYLIFHSDSLPSIRNGMEGRLCRYGKAGKGRANWDTNVSTRKAGKEKTDEALTDENGGKKAKMGLVEREEIIRELCSIRISRRTPMYSDRLWSNIN